MHTPPTATPNAPRATTPFVGWNALRIPPSPQSGVLLTNPQSGVPALNPVRAALLLATLLLTPLDPANAQMDSREGIALQNQILELRRDLQSLQSQRGGNLSPPVPRGGSGGNEISAQLLDRVATLEDTVRRLTGQLDEQSNAQRRLRDDLNKQIADLAFRLQASPPTSPQGIAPPPPGPPAAPPPNGRRPPELAMQEGNAALARRDYPMAEAAAREVLAGPRGPRSADAQFLLAQSLTGKRDYQGAALAYDDAYSRAKTGPRAPDALLGIANALLALNDKAASCASLDKLRAEFPALRGPVRDAAAALRSRAGCR